MQVSRVNKVFARLGRFQVRFRWLILLITAIVTVLACLGLPRLQMTSSDEEWFDDWDKVKIDQAHFNEKFGSDDGYMVMVRADDVFAPEVLQAIDRLSRRLENEVPYADRVVSLTHNLSIPVARHWHQEPFPREPLIVHPHQLLSRTEERIRKMLSPLPISRRQTAKSSYK